MPHSYGKIKDFTELDFESPSTKEVVYILGYLWADGCLSKTTNRLSLEIKEEDAIVIKELMMSIGKWNLYRRHRSPSKPTLNFYINNKEFADILRGYGFEDKTTTSSALKMLLKMPQELQYYWYRGYFDGDGYILANKNVRWISIYILWLI